MTYGPPLFAFFIASLVVALELVTTHYPRTYAFITKCSQFYAYVMIYGAIAFLVAMSADILIEADFIDMSGVGLSDPWIRAFAIGLTVKAFLHVKLFQVGVGDNTMPIGTETIVQMFEPWLLERIVFHEFNSIRSYLSPWEKRITDTKVVKATIFRNLPPEHIFGGPDRGAFESSINKRSNEAIDCMELYLRRFGKVSFERAFKDVCG